MFKLRSLPSAEALGVLDNRYPDIDHSVVKALLVLARLGHDMAAAMEAFLARYGLCQGTFFCLTILNRDPDTPCSASPLAKALGVSPPALTSVLTKLDNLGYIERRIDPADRRRLSVSLSPAGRRFLDEIMPVCTAAVTGFMRTVPDEEIGQLADFLGRILSASEPGGAERVEPDNLRPAKMPEGGYRIGESNRANITAVLNPNQRAV
jgi:DNA-binding MarR family transcriptional regulator